MIIVRYARVPTELMETSIPEGIKFSVVQGEDGTERQKTLREFVFTHLTWDMDDSTTIFRLACDESGRGYRYIRGTDEDDMIDWEFYLTQFGAYGADTWLTHEEVMQLIPQPEI